VDGGGTLQFDHADAVLDRADVLAQVTANAVVAVDGQM
jgi:hypothetical protein